MTWDMLLSIQSEINCEALAQNIADNLKTKDIIKFILSIEESVEDWEFTKQLYEKLFEIMKDYPN